MSEYGQSFYDKRRSLARSSADAVVPLVVEIVAPKRVVDLGCGEGTWLQAFRDRGVGEVLGIEGDWLDKSSLEIPQDCFRHHDLSQPLDLGRSFDLAISVEVAEHLDEENAAAFVNTLTGLAPVVLFSAAVPYQGGTGHVNERWPAYWARRFAERGYVPVDILRRRIWQDERVAWWYRQNLVFYANESALSANDVLEQGAAATPAEPDALVHPDLFLPRVDGRARSRDLRNLKLGRVIRALPLIAWNSFKRLMTNS